MIESAFQAAMTEAGLVSRDAILADGRLRRFRVEGDTTGSRNGWYVLHADGVPSGVFGSWKTGLKGSWCIKAQHDLTATELAENRRRIDAARKAREAEVREVRKEAQERASMIWLASAPAPASHPYFIKKGVKNYGLKIANGALVIPLHDSAEVLHSLQFIDGEGKKRFLSGGRKRSCYYSIGQVKDTLCIAEGYATAASVHEATGHAVVVAFDAGNLLPVAQALRQKFPDAEIILCADNDINTPGNPGLTHAREAATAVGALLAIPPCAGDFNDLLTGGTQ